MGTQTKQAKRVAHFMGTVFAQNTACSKFVPFGSPLVTTADLGSVTCKRCLTAMGGSR